MTGGERITLIGEGFAATDTKDLPEEATFQTRLTIHESQIVSRLKVKRGGDVRI